MLFVSEHAGKLAGRVLKAAGDEGAAVHSEPEWAGGGVSERVDGLAAQRGLRGRTRLPTRRGRCGEDAAHGRSPLCLAMGRMSAAVPSSTRKCVVLELQARKTHTYRILQRWE